MRLILAVSLLCVAVWSVPLEKVPLKLEATAIADTCIDEISGMTKTTIDIQKAKTAQIVKDAIPLRLQNPDGKWVTVTKPAAQKKVAFDMARGDFAGRIAATSCQKSVGIAGFVLCGAANTHTAHTKPSSFDDVATKITNGGDKEVLLFGFNGVGTDHWVTFITSSTHVIILQAYEGHYTLSEWISGKKFDDNANAVTDADLVAARNFWGLNNNKNGILKATAVNEIKKLDSLNSAEVTKKTEAEAAYKLLFGAANTASAPKMISLTGCTCSDGACNTHAQEAQFNHLTLPLDALSED